MLLSHSWDGVCELQDGQSCGLGAASGRGLLLWDPNTSLDMACAFPLLGSGSEQCERAVLWGRLKAEVWLFREQTDIKSKWLDITRKRFGKGRRVLPKQVVQVEESGVRAMQDSCKMTLRSKGTPQN